MTFTSNLNKKIKWNENKVNFKPTINKVSGTLTEYEQWYLKTFGRLPMYEIQ